MQQQMEPRQEDQKPSINMIELDLEYYASLSESAIIDALGRFIGIAKPKWSPQAMFQARAELPIDAQDAPRHFNNPLFAEVGGEKEAKWVVDLDPVWTRITRTMSRGHTQPRQEDQKPSMNMIELDLEYYASLSESAIIDALGRFIGIAKPKWSPQAMFQARAELPIDAQDAPRHFNNPLFAEVGGEKEAKWVVDLDPVWTRITRTMSQDSSTRGDDSVTFQPSVRPSMTTLLVSSSNAIFTETGEVNWATFVEVD